VTFNPIAGDSVSSWSNKIDPLLAKMAASSGGRQTPEYLYESLAAGKFWLAEIDNWRAAAVFRRINWPTGLNELEIVGIGGEGLRDWANTVVDLERLARELSFGRLSTPCAREGWLPFATKHGWRKAGVILEKDLSDG
jgi:hypothetical protein